MELISESPKIKVGHVTGIMKLVEKLKETQVDSTFSSVEVIIGLLSEVERISSSMSGVCKALHQKRNTTANTFAVDIDSGKAVSHLKEASIKVKKQNDFAGVDANKLRL
ncbi:hypothetical protein GLOIN_2v1658885 [Rhizophagus irregularis DAOM 181602=DAOM 197198]|nr:hypothetical protein GLOIN_2v1658885 [Rhizophagus irregularis DAOM 181602=DAOM 197198]